MKQRFYVLILLSLLLLFSITRINAQVTIGAGLEPESGALLDLKETQSANPSANDITTLENSTKGLLFPKVSVKEWNKLTPIYGGAHLGSGTWEDNSTPLQKVLATGMVVYNVNPDARNMDVGLYAWNGEEWIPLFGNTIGIAEYSILNCQVDISGTYRVGTSLKPNENYVTVEVNVSRTGVYDFMITTNPENGYYFSASGKFLRTGTNTILVPGGGTPINTGDNLLRYWIDGVEHIPTPPPCEKELRVIGDKPKYTFVCNDVKVSGTYTVGEQLDATHYIEIDLTVPLEDDGLTWTIDTDLKNGYKFAGSGTLQYGLQKIYLYGQGIPQVSGTDEITINHNSEVKPPACKLNIPVAGPKANYGITCTATTIQGAYIQNQPLTAANYIEVTVNFPASEVGKYYLMETDELNGYKFRATGNFQNGVNKIRLYGSGTPIDVQHDTFTITTNTSRSDAKCQFEVPISMRKMVVAFFSNNVKDSKWCLSFPGKRSARMILDNKAIFGPGMQAKLNVSEIESVVTLTSPWDNDPVTGNIALRNMIRVGNTTPPDIIILGHEFLLEQSTINDLVDYVNSGGVLIHCTDHDNIGGNHRYERARDMLRGIFNKPDIEISNREFYKNVMKLEPNVDVVMGKYENISGKYIGRDGGWNFGAFADRLPADAQVIAYQENVNSRQVARALRHATRGFFFFGDAGFFSGGIDDVFEKETEYGPAKVDNTGNPVYHLTKHYINPENTSEGVCNAHLFANIMIWSIEYAHRERPNGGPIR